MNETLVFGGMTGVGGVVTIEEEEVQVWARRVTGLTPWRMILQQVNRFFVALTGTLFV